MFFEGWWPGHVSGGVVWLCKKKLPSATESTEHWHDFRQAVCPLTPACFYSAGRLISQQTHWQFKAAAVVLLAGVTRKAQETPSRMRQERCEMMIPQQPAQTVQPVPAPLAAYVALLDWKMNEWCLCDYCVIRRRDIPVGQEMSVRSGRKQTRLCSFASLIVAGPVA